MVSLDLIFLNIFLIFQGIFASDLTFELPDKGKECFYEEIKANASATLEFQVITGGQYDVDVTLLDPRQNIIYQQDKMQFDSHTFTAPMTGVYSACFSNEFSTFSHKLVYIDFQVGDESPLPGLNEHVTALTQMETSAVDIHAYLNAIIDLQTHNRLRESQGRRRAEFLNERVLIWSILESLSIIIIGASQTWMLKSFFSEKRPVGGRYFF